MGKPFAWTIARLNGRGMPAVIMDDGGQPVSRSDIDRDGKTGVLNGTSADSEGTTKGAGDVISASDSRESALKKETDAATETTVMATTAAPASDEQRISRMNDLPDEIAHITEGFVPLSLLLTRLAQTTHNSLQDRIAEMAKMPVPASAMNGSSSHPTQDDGSNENMRKKVALLNFAQDMHGKWVKALVIAEWSRKSEMVSKLIDLKWHIDQQRILYDGMLDQIVNIKRDLTFARMPSPDLKTALQILSTGTAPWMPDVSLSVALIRTHY